MPNKLPAIGSIVLYFDKKSKNPADFTGYNQVGIVIDENKMLIKRKKSIVEVKSIDSPNGQYSLRTPNSAKAAKLIVTYFKDNVMNVPLFDRGMASLVDSKRAHLFDSPLLMPKFMDRSVNDYEEKWRAIESKAQAGDLIFTYDSHSLISKLIAGFDKGAWSHVATYMGDGMLCEAITSGVTKRNINHYKQPNIMVGLYRFPNITEDQAKNIKAFHEKQIGKPYNYLGVIKLALKMVLGLKSKIPTPNGIIYRGDLLLVEWV